MKKHILTSVFILSLFSLNAFAQDVIKQVPCENAAIRLQVDSLKPIWEKQGFKLMKESTVSMPSGFEIPIIVPLKGGSLYHVIFIGDMSTRKYEVTMYDWEENKVAYEKKMWGDVDGNIISYDYVPRGTQYHMIKTMQLNKKMKDVCGYFMLFKKVS